MKAQAMKAAKRRVTVGVITTAITVLLAALLAGCATGRSLGWTSEGAPPAQATLPPPPAPVPVSRVLPAGHGVPIGVYESGFPDNPSAASAFAAAIGVQPRMVEYFSSWKEPFMGTFAKAAHAGGAVPVVQLEPSNVPLASIIAGQSDAYLRQFALSVRLYRYPVILSFGHEMNGYWYSWGNTKSPPAQFIAAWQHVVTVFRTAGATNVKWLWAVNNFVGGGTATTISGDVHQWWPGQQWVDLVGIDGYYYTTGLTFKSVFGTAITAIRQFSTAPMMIAETAVGTTADRETQISGLLAEAKARDLFGIVWFDATQNSGLYHQNWNLEADPTAAAAFKAAVASS
jgi:mannan endo-1,4-beta-mannosidase